MYKVTNKDFKYYARNYIGKDLDLKLSNGKYASISKLDKFIESIKFCEEDKPMIVKDDDGNGYYVTEYHYNYHEKNFVFMCIDVNGNRQINELLMYLNKYGEEEFKNSLIEFSQRYEPSRKIDMWLFLENFRDKYGTKVDFYSGEIIKKPK